MNAGRPRSFDKEAALTKALEVFWRNGYSATSLSHLTEAMGITKPSLYAAFGNKEALFVSALNEYVQKHGLPHVEKLHTEGLSLKVRLRNYLTSLVGMQTDARLPGGCFVTDCTCEAGGDGLPSEALHAVTHINEATTKALSAFFKNEQAKGNIADDQSPQLLADSLLSLQFGLAVMARNGAGMARLKHVIEHALNGF